MSKENEAKDLIITALRQRIGEIVSSYESQVALLRAEFTMLQNDFEHITKVLKEAEDEKNASKKFIPPEVVTT
jgi:hypothetical protein